ncbi:MAG: hypothetical protein ABI134_18025 [Byssovorax sp.]
MTMPRPASSALLLLVSLAISGLACSNDPASTSTTSASASATTGSSGSGGAGGADATSSSSSAGGSGGAGGAATATGSTSSTGGSGGSGGGASVPLAGFGEITGACGVLSAMDIQSSSPLLVRDAIDFGMAVFDPTKLSPGGQTIYDQGNLGGSSLESEIISYEVLYRCELATLLKTEAQVLYQSSMGKKTDLLVSMDSFKVGVSVTRAYGFPPDAPYTVMQAHDLLVKKLSEIQLSTANVTPADAWKKQILHVIAYTSAHADAMEQAYAMVDPAVRADTVVLLTVTEGSDEFIY